MKHGFQLQKLQSARRAIRFAGLTALFTLFLGGASVRAADMLTADEMAKLQERTVDSARNTTFEFTTSTEILATPDAKKAFLQTGKIQFILFCALNEVKTRGGRTLSQRQNGTAEIRVLDKDKKIVASATKPLEKMCTA
jgi:hypothetical protein